MKAYDTFSPSIPVEEERLERRPLPSADEALLSEAVRPRKKRAVQSGNATQRVKKTREITKEKIDYIGKIRGFITGETLRLIFGLFLGCLAVYIGVSFISYFTACIADQSEINSSGIGEAINISNQGGEGGARLSEFLINECFGVGSLVIVIWLAGMSLKHLVGKPKFKSVNFTIKCIVALITLSLIVGLLTLGFNTSVNWGGYHGRFVNEFIINFFGWTGAIILCIFMLGCFVLICMRDVVKWVLRLKAKYDEKRRIERERQAEIRAREQELEEMRRFEEVEEGNNAYIPPAEDEATSKEKVEFGSEESGLYGSLPDFEQMEYELDDPELFSSSQSGAENTEAVDSPTIDNYSTTENYNQPEVETVNSSSEDTLSNTLSIQNSEQNNNGSTEVEENPEPFNQYDNNSQEEIADNYLEQPYSEPLNEEGRSQLADNNSDTHLLDNPENPAEEDITAGENDTFVTSERVDTEETLEAENLSSPNTVSSTESYESGIESYESIEAIEETITPSDSNDSLIPSLSGEHDSVIPSEVKEVSNISSQLIPTSPSVNSQNAESNDLLGESFNRDIDEVTSSQSQTVVAAQSQKNEGVEMVVNVNHISETNARRTVVAPPQQGSFPYKFPSFDLLAEGQGRIIIDEDEQQENKDRIERTLLDFKIPITSIRATIGPTVTLYEIVPDKGVKVASIKRLVDDIALSLSAEGVRIIAPIPGKGTVGIEVANKKRQSVSMRTVIKSKSFHENKFELPVAIGSTISNEVFIADLAKMPHLLVAGSTGQGKSVGLNAIIASLLYSKRPDELKFVMVDPKQVEFALYEPIESHYLAKLPEAEEAIITDMNKAVDTLNSLVVEMENRYRLLKDIHTKNITEYNRKVKEGLANPADGHRFMPYIVVVVDEFADLIMNVGKEVEKPIARLAQKARAVGIHVIIATQRPSADVITGMIKNNFPARIAFKVGSGIDSKTILDTTGAQYLIGKGDLLILNNGPVTRVQCAFIDTPEVENIVEHIRKQPYGQGAYILPEPESEDASKDNPSAASLNEIDVLLPDCARLVVSSNHGSTSALQRNFSLGYNRAGKIMDQMAALKIVGPSQGGKTRDVLVDMFRLEEILANLPNRR